MQSLYMTHLFSRNDSGTENWIEPISGNRCHRVVSPSGGKTSSWVAFCNIFKRDAALNEILNRPRHRGLCSRSPVPKSVDLYRWDHYRFDAQEDMLLRLQSHVTDTPCGFQPVRNSFLRLRDARVPTNDDVFENLLKPRLKQKYLVTREVTYLYVCIRFYAISEITSL
jgi:hypothetical protein